MKYIAAIVLSAGALSAQTFITGQSARAVIGQPNFTAQVDPTVADPAANGFALGGVSGLAYANGTLFVVDSNRVGALPDNDRVVVYPNISTPPYVAGLNLPSPTQEIIYGDFGTSTFIRCPICVVNAGFVLGQPNSSTFGENLSQSGFNEPAGVASNGQILAVADTNNNRVLIWTSMPSTFNAPANLVLGQTGFGSIGPPAVTQSAMRGPESVWIQGNRLFVADTLNNRVLIWNSIPTQNNQPADIVLGQPNFTTTQSGSVTVTPVTTASSMISPTGVSSDGTHLFVADLGESRIMIWNTIPTQDNQPADVEIGQPDMTTAIPNDAFSGSPATTAGSSDVEVPVMCNDVVPAQLDANGKPTYQQRCAYTIDFPRYVLSDGTRLFVADSGNDRVMVYNTIPTQNAVAADEILGEPDQFTDQVSDSGSAADNVEISGSDEVRTPMALAWDGTNLYVSDPFDRRVVVYTASATPLAPTSAYNAASLETFASALFSFAGSITTGDAVNLTITDPNNTSAGYTAPVYTYTVAKNDTFDNITKGLSAAVNKSNCTTVNSTSICAGDPVVVARAELGAATVLLSAKVPGANGDGIEYSITLTGTSGNSATESVSPASGSTAGGTTAATLAPGMLIAVFGSGFTDQAPASAPGGGSTELPETMAGTELYIDGVRAPLLYVSPTQINAQIPFEFSDANGSTAWVRTQHSDGTVTATNSIAMPLAPQDPGLFTLNEGAGTDPRPGLAFQASSYALGAIDIEGLPTATSVASVMIGSTTYSYTVQTADVTAFNVVTNNPPFVTTGSTPTGCPAPVNGVPPAGCVLTATTTSVTPDVLEIIREHLVQQINADPNAQVTAYEGSQFWYLMLVAKNPGTAGDGISITTTATAANSSSLTLTVLTSYNSASATCCASNGGTLITTNNPAVPGGFLVMYASGMGTLVSSYSGGYYCPTASPGTPDQNFTPTGVVCTLSTLNPDLISPAPSSPFPAPPFLPPPPATGVPFTGPAQNTLINFASGNAGGAAVNILDASLVPGSIGLYRLLIQLDSSVATNSFTPLTIYQDVYNSNTVTIAVQSQ
jgi:uncharacterized protein (TIGR03437 family)